MINQMIRLIQCLQNIPCFPSFFGYNKYYILGICMFKEKCGVKELTLLTWLTQLGLSVALPLTGFIFLALWLRSQFGLGDWVLWAGVVLGLVSALDGLRQSLKLLIRLTRKKSGDTPPPVSYNDHD